MASVVFALAVPAVLCLAWWLGAQLDREPWEPQEPRRRRPVEDVDLRGDRL